MVPHPGTPLGARDLRPLNAPIPIEVQADTHGRPVAVRRRGWAAPRQVAEILDCWRIDDEWWRERPITRRYYRLLLADGAPLTVYHDLHRDRWFAQRA